MTREEFEIAYARALARSDWASALRVVSERIDHATDKHELSYLKGEFDTCKLNQPKKTFSFDWLKRRWRVTQ